MANAVGGLKGAASGAMAGASMGPYGALAGGAIGGLMGLFGGGGDAPKPAPVNLLQATDPTQLNTAWTQQQHGMQQQQQFLDALKAQNGIQNQSNVYGQYQNLAAGQGPNPAQAALAQATGQNVANQAALMASQRGAGANAGLMARQAAQQGAATQQQAVGQSATMQAQQQLAALNAMQGIAGQQVGQLQTGVGDYNRFALNEQQNQMGAAAQYNAAQNAAAGNENTFNAPLALEQQKNSQNMMGGLMSGAGSAITALKGSGGGGGGGMGGMSVPSTEESFKMPAFGSSLGGGGGGGPHLAQGGAVPGPSSYVGRHLRGGSPQPAFAHGGQVPALVSPGERYLPPKEVEKVAKGEKSPMKAGEKIPGKPKVGGSKNDYANDTVHKTLKEGGIVLPRSVTQSQDPAGEAHRFISAILAKKGGGLKK